jgi:hypothetical protein
MTQPCPGFHRVEMLQVPFGQVVKHEVHKLCPTCKRYWPGTTAFDALIPGIVDGECCNFLERDAQTQQA